eukprot:TRINITY_DN9522_c0_g1_i1.p2 TRINITY_DN9522_c0_g1~~TRINITY_DN9522_c0_g1_i1.p2  ORF type:complete len:238 (-),score=35.30 TRINITY_DN9522_c0_g1_i1:39-752(-)
MKEPGRVSSPTNRCKRGTCVANPRKLTKESSGSSSTPSLPRSSSTVSTTASCSSSGSVISPIATPTTQSAPKTDNSWSEQPIEAKSNGSPKASHAAVETAPAKQVRFASRNEMLEKCPTRDLLLRVSEEAARLRLSNSDNLQPCLSSPSHGIAVHSLDGSAEAGCAGESLLAKKVSRKAEKVVKKRSKDTSPSEKDDTQVRAKAGSKEKDGMEVRTGAFKVIGGCCLLTQLFALGST